MKRVIRLAARDDIADAAEFYSSGKWYRVYFPASWLFSPFRQYKAIDKS